MQDMTIDVSPAKIEALFLAGEDLCSALKAKTVSLTASEVRNIVDMYYASQKIRIIANNQIKATGRDEEKAEVPTHERDKMRLTHLVLDIHLGVENLIKKALDAWTDEEPVSAWAKGILGIGPILAAGLSAHVDIARAPTVSCLWSFAGLNPNAKWEKGQKRPWNARLKVLCWKIGQSFIKVSGNPRSFYGAEYVRAKKEILAKNESGGYGESAAAKLKEGRLNDTKEARKHLEAGHLPPFIMDRMASRKATKLFLSHWWEVAYRERYGKAPPPPYSITVLGHTGFVSLEQVAQYEGI